MLQYEFKADLAAYLATRPDAPIKSIDDLIRFNEEHAAEEMPYFRQERLVSCAEGPLTDERVPGRARHNQEFGRAFVAFLDEQRFDALVAPTNAPPWTIDAIDGDRHLGGSSMVPAITGFPLITVPAGYASTCCRVGLTFMGRPWSSQRCCGWRTRSSRPIRCVGRRVTGRPCSTCRNSGLLARVLATG